MGTFSIWHWVVFFVVVFLMFGLPALAIAKESSELLTSRREFLLWIAAALGVPLIIGTAVVLLGGDEKTANGIGMLFVFLIIYPLFQRYVRRARDAGMGKLIAYLSIIPGVILATTVILLLKPGRAKARTSPTS